MVKRNRKKHRNPKKAPPSDFSFVQIKHPFANIPHDVLTEGLLEAGQAFSAKFEQSLEKLKLSVKSVNLLHLLSVLSFYGLSEFLTETGERAKRVSESSILPPHIELTQTLALQIPLQEQAAKPAGPDQIQEIWDLLIDTGKAFAMKRLMQLNESRTKEEKAILYLQEQFRNHTHYVRNWGFFNQVVNILKKLYAPLDPIYKDKVGIGGTELIEVFKCMLARMEIAFSNHRNKLSAMFKRQSIDEAVNAYYRAYPDLQGSSTNLIEYFRAHKIPLESVKTILVTHSDLYLSDAFTFSCQDLAKEVGVESINLSRALNMLSYRFGDLKDENPEHFFLGNPVWTKPLVQLSDDHYFTACPLMFFNFVFQIFDELLSSDEQARATCSKRRAAFLEEEVAALMEKAFPDSCCIRNFKWRDDSIEYETDILLKIDSYILLVEAKSGAITQPALRGAPNRIKRHVKEILIEPTIQSMRFAEKLWELKLSNKSAPDFPFDLTSVQKIVRLSVTLEDVANIQSNVDILKSTGWLQDNISVAPTMTLADLGVVLDILGSGPERIHYLTRRAELEEHTKYLGYELDLLGFYLETGFNIGDAEFDSTPIITIGTSKAIDDYYAALDRGIKRSKPSLKTTKRWSDIRQKIEERHFERWSEVAVILLNVAYDDQIKMEKMLTKIVKNVKKNWFMPRYQNSAILSPPPWRNDAIGIVAYRESQHDKRLELMQDIANRIFSKGHATRCLIMGFNIDVGHYPYSILAVIDRS